MVSEPTKDSVGDQLQSAASRMRECLICLQENTGAILPYEVRISMIEAQKAIDDWTKLRKKD